MGKLPADQGDHNPLDHFLQKSTLVSHVRGTARLTYTAGTQLGRKRVISECCPGWTAEDRDPPGRPPTCLLGSCEQATVLS